ncbi:MAG: bifunctional metallophosphatase/5'-nucleotidase [Ardenticatenaceae bacterium]|nr:bifunctional metallophosphatase/5'-nucleotidase [Ardenticatenaceae bacterium]
MFIGFLVGCGADTPVPTPTVAVTATVVAEATVAAEATAVPTPSATRTITILYTNDEHGWLEGTESDAGAANLMGLLREREGYAPGSDVLLVSGGDMWTGPAISTWFDGESMAEVMNAMGYVAAAVGNHEFDFGLEMLQVRALQSEFPLLSANMHALGDTSLADLGIEPYTLVELDGLTVGIIGLTTTSTPYTTNPVNVATFEFGDYETALREVVPEVQAAGADLILVAAHACRDEITALARRVSDLGIDLIGGGHCNELFADTINGIVVMEGGAHLQSYARAVFAVDAAGAVTATDYGTVSNQGGAPDADIADIVARWQEMAAAELNVVIAYADTAVARRSPAMQALITESWLWAYPTADVAITNMGGMRDALPAGDITLGAVIGVMPFNNVLVDLTLTGAQLERVLTIAQDDAIGGVSRQGGSWVLHKTGAALDPNGTYHLLVNDFMYAGGDNYALLANLDPQAYNTAIDWRQPVIDWLLAQASSQQQPVDAAIAALLGN